MLQKGRFRTQWNVALILLPCLLILLAGNVPKVFGAELEKVRVVYSSITASQCVTWIAEEAGIYKKYGLDVQLIYVSSGSRAISMLLSGDAPLLISAGTPAVSAALGGADVKIVAGLLNSFPYYVVGARGITRADQLRGKKIGISRFGSSGHAASVYAMRKLGLEPGKDVTLIQLGGGAERFAAMASGAIQGTLLTPPQELIAKKQGYNVIANVSELGIPFLHSSVVTRQRTIGSQREMVSKYLMAIVDGIHFMKTQRPETLKLFAKFFRTNDMEAVLDTYDDYVPKAPQIPYTQPQAVQTVLQIISEERPEAKKARPEQFIDNSFLEELSKSGFVTKLYAQ